MRHEELLDLLAGASPDAKRWKDITADLISQFAEWDENQPWDYEQGLCFWCHEWVSAGAAHNPACAWLRASKALGY